MISNAQLAVGATLALINRSKIDSWQVCKKLYLTLISSVLLFASSVWGVQNLDEVEKVQSAFFKKLLFLPLNTPSYALKLETGTQRLSIQIFKNCLSWINKILEMEDNRYPRICFLKLVDLFNKFDKTEQKFNWVTQIQRQFFEPIGLNLADYLKSEKIRKNINFLLDKLNRSYLREDIAKVSESSSLYFARFINYEISQSRHFNWLKLDKLRSITQIRLCNKYNSRLILEHKLYTIRQNELCYWCRTKNDIFHMLNNCMMFNEIRAHNVSNDSSFLEMMNCDSSEKIEKLIKLSISILERYVLIT